MSKETKTCSLEISASFLFGMFRVSKKLEKQDLLGDDFLEMSISIATDRDDFSSGIFTKLFSLSLK